MWWPTKPFYWIISRRYLKSIEGEQGTVPWFRCASRLLPFQRHLHETESAGYNGIPISQVEISLAAESVRKAAIDKETFLNIQGQRQFEELHQGTKKLDEEAAEINIKILNQAYRKDYDPNSSSVPIKKNQDGPSKQHASLDEVKSNGDFSRMLPALTDETSRAQAAAKTEFNATHFIPFNFYKTLIVSLVLIATDIGFNFGFFNVLAMAGNGSISGQGFLQILPKLFFLPALGAFSYWLAVVVSEKGKEIFNRALWVIFFLALVTVALFSVAQGVKNSRWVIDTFAPLETKSIENEISDNEHMLATTKEKEVKEIKKKEIVDLREKQKKLIKDREVFFVSFFMGRDAYAAGSFAFYLMPFLTVLLTGFTLFELRRYYAMWRQRRELPAFLRSIEKFKTKRIELVGILEELRQHKNQAHQNVRCVQAELIRGNIFGLINATDDSALGSKQLSLSGQNDGQSHTKTVNSAPSKPNTAGQAILSSADRRYEWKKGSAGEVAILPVNESEMLPKNTEGVPSKINQNLPVESQVNSSANKVQSARDAISGLRLLGDESKIVTPPDQGIHQPDDGLKLVVGGNGKHSSHGGGNHA